MYREALAIDKKIFGTEHPNVARDLNNLAVLLEKQVSEWFFVLFSTTERGI